MTGLMRRRKFRRPTEGSPEMKFFRQFLRKLRSPDAYRIWRPTKKKFRSKWTHVVTRALKEACEETLRGVQVACKGMCDIEKRAEYLALDLVAWRDDGPLVLAAEHENNLDPSKIRYCTWKLLCVDAKQRVLVCYVNSKSDSPKQAQSPDALLDEAIRPVVAKHRGKNLLVIIGEWQNGPRKNGTWSKLFQAYLPVWSTGRRKA